VGIEQKNVVDREIVESTPQLLLPEKLKVEHKLGAIPGRYFFFFFDGLDREGKKVGQGTGRSVEGNLSNCQQV